MEYTKKSSQDIKTWQQFVDRETFKEFLLNSFMLEQGMTVAEALQEWEFDNRAICKMGLKYKGIEWIDEHKTYDGQLVHAHFIIRVIDCATKCPFELFTKYDERGLFI